MKPPLLVNHLGVSVVRDDQFPGGTKARFAAELWQDCDEIVYASPAEGGAQTALATVAAQIGKRATIFIAKRKAPHDRALMAKRLGAKVIQVSPGYLSVVRRRAAEYCEARRAKLLPFGLHVECAGERIAAAAASTGLQPREVWCVAGSGVLSRGLHRAWPDARFFCVQIGRDLSPQDVPPGAEVIVSPLRFEQPERAEVPFPSDPHYDAKGWVALMASRSESERAGVVFWNVTGPAVR